MVNKARCRCCGARVVVINSRDYPKAIKLWNEIKSKGESLIELDTFYSLGYNESSILANSRQAREKAREYEEVNKYKELYGLPVFATYTARRPDKNDNTTYVVYARLSSTVTEKYIVSSGDTTCPICQNQTIFDSDDEQLIEYDKNEVNSYIEKVRSTYYKEPNNDGTAKVDVSFDMKEYLSHLINIEEGIEFLEQKIKNDVQSLLPVNRKLVRIAADNSKTIDKKITEHSKKLEKDLIEAKKKLAAVGSFTDGEKDKICEKHGLYRPVSPIMPAAPQEPVPPVQPTLIEPDPSLLIEPVEPVYETPGLFNKKRVLQENETRKKEYEAKVNAYQEAVKTHNSNVSRAREYDAAAAKYQSEISVYRDQYYRYQTELEAYNRAVSEYEAVLAQYNTARDQYVSEEVEKAKSKNEAKLQNKINECEAAINDFNKKIKEGTASELVLMDVKEYKEPKLEAVLIESELEDSVKELSEQYSAKQKLLGINVIYKKYNDIVAWTTMYEYYLTGRCSELSGPNGAYNLFESETRANIIINKLDIIIDQLDAIKKNQYMLYQVLVSIDEGIKDLGSKMSVVMGELALLHIDNLVQDALLAAIAGNTAYTAYNSAKVAKFSEIQAKRGAAMVFIGRL